MTNHSLPPEILDCVIDLLHNESDALKQCCLVSKSWVPRARNYLFADIKLQSAGELGSWKKTFQDIENSPAHHARALFVGCAHLVTASDGGWLRAFSGIKSLGLDGHIERLRDLRDSEISLAPFRKLSPTLKSLRMRSALLPFRGLSDFICSFPLLEDLALAGYQYMQLNINPPDPPQSDNPSPSPPLTGSLDFHLLWGAGDVAQQLMDLPNGIHFQNIVALRDVEGDFRWMTQLVERCSHTLKSLKVDYTSYCVFIHIRVRINNLTLFQGGRGPSSFDLSTATNLRDLVFQPESQCAWVTVALQTITPKHRDLRRISIHVHHSLTDYGASVMDDLGEATFRKWLDLDRLLVQLWESRSIRPKVGCVRPAQVHQNTEYCIAALFPEITKRGIVDPL